MTQQMLQLEEPTDKITLRDYQRAAIDTTYGFWEGGQGNPLIVVPTGGGKSLIHGKFMEEVLHYSPDAKMLSVTHVRELVDQNYKELRELWPSAPAGIFSAGLNRRESWFPIIFCSIQSVHNKVHLFGKVDICFVDEAHLIPRRTSTMYQRFITGLLEANPKMKVVGLTATPYRLDSGRLDKGEDTIFDGISYDVSTKKLIEEGYLLPLISKMTAVRLDVEHVKKRGGEFVQKDLQAAVDKYEITREAVKETVAYGAKRKAWLIFAAGVDHAHHVAEEVRGHGFSCEVVTGDTNKLDRTRFVEAFKAGQIRCLVNVGVLTTGFNAKNLDLIALLRPTESTGLYIQMLGRGTRPLYDVGHDLSTADGRQKAIEVSEKQNCLILDFAGNVARHGPFDDPFIKDRSRKGEAGEAPVKVCPECHSILHTSIRDCPDCGYEFPPPEAIETKIKKTADGRPIMANQPAQWVDVTGWDAHFHSPKIDGKPPSLRIEYTVGMEVFKEWWFPEHKGFARNKTERFWRESGGDGCPATVEECVEDFPMLEKPDQICLAPDGKFFKIIGRTFASITNPPPQKEEPPARIPLASDPSWDAYKPSGRDITDNPEDRREPITDDDIPF